MQDSNRSQTVARSLPIIGAFFALLLTVCRPAAANPHEARIPLHDGKVVLADLCKRLSAELGIESIAAPAGSLDLNGLKGSNFIAAIDEALGAGCQITITADAVVLSIDPDKLPANCEAAKRAVRIFTAIEAPDSTAAQRAFFGLHAPEWIDPSRPIVVLVHGLDSDRTIWGPLAGRLNFDGYQVAYFSYPSDGPIDESAAMLATQLTALHTKYPTMKIDLICHSMGSLVARDYVEGPRYTGGVDHLLLCGPPNGGSTWAKYRLVLELREHYELWKHEPGWSPTWMITDGLGEAGTDMKPGSAFLKRLNAQPRREHVRYTIVAGNQHLARRIGADWLDSTAHWLPERMTGWWGFRQCTQCMESEAKSVRQTPGDGDGPVLLKAAKLAGVKDFVVVHADHAGLCTADPPAAWPTIRDRLKD